MNENLDSFKEVIELLILLFGGGFLGSWFKSKQENKNSAWDKLTEFNNISNERYLEELDKNTELKKQIDDVKNKLHDATTQSIDNINKLRSVNTQVPDIIRDYQCVVNSIKELDVNDDDLKEVLKDANRIMDDLLYLRETVRDDIKDSVDKIDLPTEETMQVLDKAQEIKEKEEKEE